MVSHLAREWWIVALRGVLGILFGVVAFVWPGMTLLVLIAFFGAYMFLDGVVALVQAIRFRHERERWPALLTEAALGIIIGVVTFFWPGVTALAWIYTIAAWALLTGALELWLAIRLRRQFSGEWFVLLTGIASIVLGIALLIMPLAGLIAWVWTIGAYAIVFGGLLIAFALRLRRGSTSAPTDFSAAAGAR